jgi:hypothetical protein
MHRRRAQRLRSPFTSAPAAAPAVAAALVVALAGCGAPSYRFLANDTDDLALKVPRAWNLVRSGVPPAADGTAGPAGSWFAVYDAADHPALEHFTARHTAAPVAMIQSAVIDKAQGQALTDDRLRDILLPVTASGRETARQQGDFTGTGFRLLSDEQVSTRTADGVHVVFRYDLGEGPEIYDQIVVTDKTRTHVHVALVRCNEACYHSNRQVIADTIRSFTVRST